MLNAQIGEYAFYMLFSNCARLTDISGLYMPATTLASYCYKQMFYGCTGLTGIPSNLLPATTLADDCYYQMFYGCTGLISIPSNLLPSTTLAYGCYEQMFYGCTGLTSLTSNLLPAMTLGTKCYCEMFYGCTRLTSIPSNLLPATTLDSRCYDQMFYGCSSLVTAPELPATTLANSCYDQMFYGCSSLVTAPELPATTLAGSCYYNMFSGCTSLVTAPALPATTLAVSCYNSMFNGCSSLTTAPALPATTLADYCYRYMFKNCSSLITTAPALPAITLAICCYNEMFTGCSSLKTAPALPATTLEERCYSSMFSGCSSLTTAPALPATTLAVNCYNSMFNGCSSLTTAPALPATTLADYCYRYMFKNCSSLITAPALPAITLAKSCYTEMFGGCSSLKTAPALHATTLAESCCSYMFNSCSSLVIAPALHATTLAKSCYKGMFNLCTSLTTAPEILPATTLAESCYYEMFYECSSLKTAPALMAVNLATKCYMYMFKNCSSLITAPELPVTTLADACYDGMFSGCSSLITAPELPATTLAQYCYANMFLGCSSLTVAPTLPAKTLVSGCYQSMFYECSSLRSVDTYATIWSSSCASSWLYGVPDTGDFFNIGKADIPSGSNGIPEGWREYDFVPIRITASSNNTSFGTVSGAGLYIKGVDCYLTATPNCGCTFINWTENNEIVSTDAEYSFKVDVDRNLVANFDVPENVCIFSGYGSWTTPSNWIGKGGQHLAELPDFTDKDVVIDGIAYIPDGTDPIVKSLTINASNVLEINDGASLTVSGAISNNNNANSLIINDGGQIFQTSTYVRATFKKNIVNPEVWGGSLTGWQFIASPITDAPISGFEPSSGDYDLFAWDVSKGDNPWVNRKAHKDDANYPYFYVSFKQGRGYLASYETQHVASFEGCIVNPNTFDFKVRGLVDYSTVQWGNLYLVGNPFTFDVNWSEFDRTNVYDGYAVMNANGSIGYADNSTPIKVGQGFMVITTSDESLTFKYPKTSKVDEADYKSINIIASNSGGSCNAILHFDGSENGGFPIVENINDEVATIYTVGSGNKYGIRSCDSDVNEIPLCFEAKEIGYNTISMKLNGDFDYVHLIDRQTGCDTDMLNGNEYKFIAATDDNANRFIVKLSSDNGANSNNNFAYQSGNQLFINGEGFVQVFDVLGRTVISENLNGNSIDISRLENASYIVRLVNQNEVKTQKIVVL